MKTKEISVICHLQLNSLPSFGLLPIDNYNIHHMSNVSKSVLSEPSDKASRIRKSLYISAFVDSISASLIMPFFPFMILKFGGDARTAGYIFALHAVLAVASGPIFGRLSDRFGRRPALVTAFFCLTVSYIVFGLASSLLAIVIARAMAGTMSGGFSVIQAAVLDLTERSERAKAVGFVVGASACGFAVGPVIGLVATAVDRDSSATWASFIGAAMLLACGILLWTMLPGRQTRKKSKTDEAPRKGLYVFGTQRMLGAKLLLAMLMVAMMQAGITAILGFWANSLFGWDERGVGWMFVWIFLSIGLNQWFVLPRMLSTLSPSKVLCAALLCVLVGTTFLVDASMHASILVSSAAIVFCGISVARTVVTTVGSTIGADSDRGAALGYISSAGYVGRALGPVVFGFLFVEAGPSAPFVATAAVAGVFFIWLLTQWKNPWGMS